MTALAEIVNKADLSSKHYSSQSITAYVNVKMIPANCKIKPLQFKAQLIEGKAPGTQTHITTWKIVNAIGAVQCAICFQFIPRFSQSKPKWNLWRELN